MDRRVRPIVWVLLWFIPYALWTVAVLYMSLVIFGENVGGTIVVNGWQNTLGMFIMWIAILRAMGVWADYALEGLVDWYFKHRG